MSFPTPFTVGWHVYSDGERDGNNRPVPAYTPPKDAPGVEVAVIGWEIPRSAVEPMQFERGHPARIIETVDLFVTPEFQPSVRDLIDLPGGQMEVVGTGESNAGNPFGWNPGSVIKLQRVTG